MGSELEPGNRTNSVAVSDVVKKLLMTFFSANIPHTRALDIYGSIHVRSDDSDVVCCVLNEHCLKPEAAASSDGRQSTPLLSGILSSHRNTASGIEYKTDWHEVGTKKSCAKKPEYSPFENKVHVGTETKNDETQAKHRKLSSLSRKLSKLKRASVEGTNYLAQSVFPEPLAFGSSGDRSGEGEKFEAKCDLAVSDDVLENDDVERSAYRSEDQSNSDDPSIDLAMVATSEVDTPQKIGARFDNEGEIEDVDSDDSHDFDPVEKGGSFPFGSQQSFNHHSAAFSAVPSIGFNNETEIFPQSAWLPPDTSTRGCSESSFDGSTKPPGPLTSEKICMYCLKIFHTNLEMSQHIQQQHNSGFPLVENKDERPYRPRYQNIYGGSELDVDRQLTCSVCSLSFRSLDGLRCHENSKHSRNKLYKCQFCAQSFLTRQAAYTHRMKFHRLVPRNPQLLAGAMAHI